MLTVHHLGASQSDRIVWLCEELGLDYALVRYERDPLTKLAPADYKALHPVGRAPVIADGDLVLAESAAIVDYVIGTYGNGRLKVEPGDPGFADYLYWFHFANGTFMPALMADLFLGRAAPDAEMTRVLRSRSDQLYRLVDQRLATSDHIAGSSFSAADILLMFPLTTMRLYVPRDLSAYPNIQAYILRMQQRPAFLSAMAKADPDLVLPTA